MSKVTVISKALNIPCKTCKNYDNCFDQFESENCKNYRREAIKKSMRAQLAGYHAFVDLLHEEQGR